MELLNENPKKNTKAAAAQGVAQIAAAVGGGIAGAAIGRASLLAGAAATIYGLYADNTYITAAGLGACAGGFAEQNAGRVSGIAGALEDIGDLGNANVSAARERARLYLQNLRRRAYLGEVDGLGNAEFEFDYPVSLSGLDGSVGNVHELLADFRDIANELSGIAGLGNLEQEDELLGELADTAEDIQVAIEQEGQIVNGLDGEDTADLLDAMQGIVDEVDSMDGLSGLDGVMGEIGEVGDIMGWDEMAGIDGTDGLEGNDEPLMLAGPDMGQAPAVYATQYEIA